MKHNYQLYTAVCRPMLSVQVQLNKNFLAITSIQRPCHLWELLLRRIAIRESLNRTDMDVLYTVLITFFLAGKRIVSGKFTAKTYWHFACLHPEAYRFETMRVTQRSIYLIQFATNIIYKAINLAFSPWSHLHPCLVLLFSSNVFLVASQWRKNNFEFIFHTLRKWDRRQWCNIICP